MEKEYLLGVDVGTTSIKVAIIDKNAKLVAGVLKVYKTAASGEGDFS